MVKDFPLLALERLARKAGAQRVSASAVKELKIVLLEMSDEIAKSAVDMSHHAKRVTVKREDVSLAAK